MLLTAFIPALSVATALGALTAAATPLEPRTALTNVNPTCWGNEPADYQDVKRVYSYLNGLGDQPCVVPPHTAFNEFWRVGTAIVGGVNTLDHYVASSCRDVSLAVQWVITNCANGNGTLAGSQAANGNGDLLVVTKHVPEA